MFHCIVLSAKVKATTGALHIRSLGVKLSELNKLDTFRLGWPDLIY